MMRRLLALFALLTGLAAVAGPAHAALGDALRVGVEQSSPSGQDTRETPETCVEKQRRQKARGERVSPCKRQQPVTIYIPTVMFGPDRAIE